MKLHHLSICLMSAVAATGAFASNPPATTKPVSHEDRVAACTHDAKALKADEQHKFIADCMKGHGSQQDKMRTCNAEARQKDLHGDERRAFMSSCLKG